MSKDVHVYMQRELRDMQKQWSHAEAQAAEALRCNRQGPSQTLHTLAFSHRS